MHFDWYSQTITQKTRPLPPTLAAQCHQPYMWQKLYKPQPTPPPLPYLSLIAASISLRPDFKPDPP